MPFTLYRYMLWELLRLMAIATVVLIQVMSIAASIKPLSEGIFDGPTYIRFVFYMMPSMLEFALPFAGAFAATLLYCRMTNDNEILACTAS
mgnify:CR=1 FL=1